MSAPKYKMLIEKSVQAALSSIEIYNKPDFKYREETFSILLINAWELLLKARLIKHHKKMDSIYEFKDSFGVKGNRLKQQVVKLNDSQVPRTITINKCLKRCLHTPDILFDKTCYDNILLLIEIRDAAVHLQNYDKQLGKTVYEIGSASLKNYVSLITKWFSYDLTKYNFYLMPLSFFHEFESIDSYSVTSKNVQVQRLIRYVSEKKIKSVNEEDNGFCLTMNVRTAFVKDKSQDYVPFSYAPEDSAQIKIVLSREEILKNFPFNTDILKEKLKKRYVKLKFNEKYNKLIKVVKEDKKCAYFYPINMLKPEGAKTVLYSPEVFKVFDNYYEKNKNNV